MQKIIGICLITLIILVACGDNKAKVETTKRFNELVGVLSLKLSNAPEKVVTTANKEWQKDDQNRELVFEPTDSELAAILKRRITTPEEARKIWYQNRLQVVADTASQQSLFIQKTKNNSGYNTSIHVIIFNLGQQALQLIEWGNCPANQKTVKSLEQLIVAVEKIPQ